VEQTIGFLRRWVFPVACASCGEPGCGLCGAVEEVSDTQIRQQFETNLFGLLNVTRAVLPLLREQKSGHILNTTSVGGQVSFPTFGPYHGTKYAIEGISESLAKEVAEFGIKVTIMSRAASRSISALVRWRAPNGLQPISPVTKRCSKPSRAQFSETPPALLRP